MSMASADDTAIRVVVADDEPLMRDGLEMLLSAQPDLTVEAVARNGAEAVQLCQRLRPDVVVMDVRMPIVDGVRATQLITADQPDGHIVRVLVLTALRDDRTVVEALRAGASGYLLKSTATTDLPRAIRAVNEGHSWLDPMVAGPLVTAFAAQPLVELGLTDAVATLTSRERDVLVLLALGYGTLDVAKYLYISEGTARTHIGRIIFKLAVPDRTAAVAAAYQSGLVKVGQAPPPGTQSR